MRLRTAFPLAAALLMSGSFSATAQTASKTGPAATAAASRAATEGAATSVAPEGSRQPPRRRGPNDSFRPRKRELLYVAVPGSLEQPGWHNGTGMVVLDVNDNWSFVKRVPTWDYASSMSPEQVAGFAGSPTTNMLYVAARGRIGAFDIATDKMVWTTVLDGKCCERPHITPDGKYVIVGSDLQDYWFKLDAQTGKLIAKIEAPRSPNAHNLNLSPDGKTAFMAPNGKVMSIADVATAKTVRTIEFPDNIRVFVLNKDASKIYTNQNNLLGFIIADAKSGKLLKTVEVTSVDWRSKWNANPRPRIPHGCPSHGIALTPDGQEIWLADGIFNKIHIFTNDENPREIATIDSQAGPGPFWMTFGLDGKYAYASSGDVIDIKTHKVVGALKDEFGRPLYSEKVLDVQVDNGHAQRISNAFANQYGDYLTAEQMGVGPHVTPKPGAANLLATSTGRDPNAGMKQVSD